MICPTAQAKFLRAGTWRVYAAENPHEISFLIAKEEFGLAGVEYRRGYPKKEAGKVKTTTIALFATVLITAAPAAPARNIHTKTPDQQHKVFKKRHQIVTSYAPWQVMHATSGARMGYPGASSYAPSAPKDYTYENSRNAGGGGGGGGSGGGGSGM